MDAWCYFMREFACKMLLINASSIDRRLLILCAKCCININPQGFPEYLYAMYSSVYNLSFVLLFVRATDCYIPMFFHHLSLKFILLWHLERTDVWKEANIQKSFWGSRWKGVATGWPFSVMSSRALFRVSLQSVAVVTRWIGFVYELRAMHCSWMSFWITSRNEFIYSATLFIRMSILSNLHATV